MNKLTEAECAAWLKIRSQETPQVFPTTAQTAEQWQSLILRQMRCPTETKTGIDDVGVWAMITTIDMDNIQEIIRRIARYGVREDDEGSGGSGDGEDIGRGQTSGGGDLSHIPSLPR